MSYCHNHNPQSIYSQIAQLRKNKIRSIVSVARRANGEYAIQLKNIKLTETDISKYYTSDLIESTVTIGGESSGIIVINNEQLTNDNEAGAWYTIDGRRLTSKPAKTGLYIHNGKKVVIE